MGCLIKVIWGESYKMVELGCFLPKPTTFQPPNWRGNEGEKVGWPTSFLFFFFLFMGYLLNDGIAYFIPKNKKSFIKY